MDEAGEGDEKADEEGDVLDRRCGLAVVTVDELCHEHLGGAAHPRADERAQRNGQRGEVC